MVGIKCSTDESNFINKCKKLVYTDVQGKYHVQGVAVDEKNEYIYYSFTDRIVKSDLNGNIVGSISGFFGHIGSIVFNPDDGKVYASLEYKHDSIGQSLVEGSQEDVSFEDAFYIAAFDVEKIVAGEYKISENPDMLKTVYLKEVLKDYKGKGVNSDGKEVEHKYGCSGIDGVCIAPLPGGRKNELYLYVAYGIYSDVNRNDNNHQVILCYKIDEFLKYGKSFDQGAMHRNGPTSYDRKYFVYTGNTKYGIQNMAYDKKSKTIFMSAYVGAKKEFPNYSLFAVDLSKKPVASELKGVGEQGEVLTLKQAVTENTGSADGWYSELGACGMCSVGKGYFYLAENVNDQGRNSVKIYLNKFDLQKGFVLLSD